MDVHERYCVGPISATALEFNIAKMLPACRLYTVFDKPGSIISAWTTFSRYAFRAIINSC